jgi:RNA polymerase sigma-70 factor (ECF subfamily)
MDTLTRLLLDARDGDRAALERFVAETERDVRQLCRHLGDRDDADDLAQETYRRAVASLHRYRAEGPARHWLLTIARRTCVDAIRSRARRRRTHRALTDQTDPTDVVAPAAVYQPEIDELLRELDDDRRAAFVLTQLSGFRYDEAAELLGVPIGTIRSRVARARAQLVALLDDRREPDADRRRPA